MANDTKFWFAASTEEFVPTQILEQHKAAEAAGFDGLGISDHWAPWFPDGEGAQAWVTMAASGQSTSLPIGTGVTPVLHHYHPGVIAQAFMSMEELFPGRVFLGVGSGEALNEVPLGLEWPEPREMLERFDQGLEAIERLWDGETVTMDAGWFALKDAKLYTRAEGKPRMYASAFGPQAAAIAGRHGQGLWTLGDSDAAPAIIDAYREACAKSGKAEGEIILHAGMAWAEDQERVVEGARRWKPTQLSEVYRDDIADPGDMQGRADEQMSDEEFAAEGFIISSDPEEHVGRIQEIEAIGASVVCLQLIGQADPAGTIELYRDTVLPQLRTG
jgi:coenzyme F420-dependent glucose-6-phosphate dehydrogenase